MFNPYLSNIADSLLNGKSVNIVVDDKKISDLYVLSLFCLYDLRNLAFKNLHNSFVFINLSDPNLVVTNVDEYFNNKLSNVFNINFTSLVDVNEYIKVAGHKLVIYFSSNDLFFIKCIFSYSFSFRDNVLFILHTTEKLNFIGQKFILDILEFNNNIEIFKKSLVELAKYLGYTNDTLCFIKIINDLLKLNFISNTDTDKLSTKLVIQNQNKITKSKNTQEKKVTKQENDRKSVIDVFNLPFLTEREVVFLEKLNEKKFLSRNEIKDILWGVNSNTITDDALDQFISRLRQKLTKNKLKKSIIQTIKGKGIRMNM